ncbi:hypothetical protein F5Y13DRAFT_204731 [Hypoxylon sp. FL1857]|nr:hypothetical protein F5Y13DRAFT_204731 [Hypoxylon sp. FL1857]
MEDAASPSTSALDQQQQHNPRRHPQSPTHRPASTIVHLPIRRRSHDFLQQFVPYDNPAVFDVRPAQWHRRQESVFLFRYTDFRGWPAVQPAADEHIIKAYLRPLTRDDERDAACDPLLLDARWWCCWAQGFTHLEPELRWVLTLVFDLVGVVIAKQKAAAAAVTAAKGSVPVGGGGGGEDVGMGVDMEPDRAKLLFWEGRYYLHNLMGVVRDMKEAFGIDNLWVPRLPWFEED